jgi:hypothetical protein
MANNWSALRAKIKTILDGLVTAGTIGAVLNGERNPQEVEMTAYPCVEIVRGQTEPDYYENTSDLQVYVFVLQLYYPIPDESWETAETTMDDKVDAVLAAFMADLSLSGSVTGRITPIANGGSVISWNGRFHRRDIITLKCPKAVSMV